MTILSMPLSLDFFRMVSELLLNFDYSTSQYFRYQLGRDYTRQNAEVLPGVEADKPS